MRKTDFLILYYSSRHRCQRLHVGILRDHPRWYGPPLHRLRSARLLLDLFLTLSDSYAIWTWAACLEFRFHDHSSYGQKVHPPHVCRQLSFSMCRCLYEAVDHQLLPPSVSTSKLTRHHVHYDGYHNWVDAGFHTGYYIPV